KWYYAVPIVVIWLLVVIAVIRIICSAAGVFSQQAELPEGTQLGAAAISEGMPKEGYRYLYFGENEGIPIEWRFLCADTSMGGEDGIFLMANRGMAFSDFGTDNKWEHSKIKDWCVDFYESDTHFTSAEKKLIMETTVEETEQDDYHYNDGSRFLHCSLEKEHIFILSAAEAMNPMFGFSESIRTDENREMQMGTRLRWWWLRSPDSKSDQIGCLIYRDGNITYDIVTRSMIGIRPVMNLLTDSSSGIFMAVPCEEYVVQEKNWVDKTQALNGQSAYWKLKLSDDTIRTPQFEDAGVRSGKLKVIFSDGKPVLEEGQCLMLLITDKQYRTAYAYIPVQDSFYRSDGTLEWELPSYYNKKKCDLYLLAEMEGEAQQTDYVSLPAKLE
ncbi:MAG TPA: DUF6273 domain-containing protein, partial [Lachnospiraceae bacterium]|nr:DUF6273 domain-containing protein [Lachnospiraceae bacterium]